MWLLAGLPAMKNLEKSVRKCVSSLRTMGRQSKATISWLNNLQKNTINTHRPIVEDDFDEDMNSDNDSDLEDSDDEELDEDKLTELQNEADMEHFLPLLRLWLRRQNMRLLVKNPSENDITLAIQIVQSNIMLKSAKSLRLLDKNSSVQYLQSGWRNLQWKQIKQAGLEVIDIFDNLYLDDSDEIEASLKELFPGQQEVSAFERIKAEMILLTSNSQASMQLQNQKYHILQEVKNQWELLINKWKNCFNNFEKADTLRTIVLKQLLIRFWMDYHTRISYPCIVHKTNLPSKLKTKSWMSSFGVVSQLWLQH